MRVRTFSLIAVIAIVLLNPLGYSTNVVGQFLPSAKVITDLVLDTPPSDVTAGETVTFTGRLLSGNSGISGKTIIIKDNDPIGDDVLGSGITDSNGRFSISWTAKKMDPTDNTVEIYAEFEDDSSYEGSKSSQYVITVTEKAPALPSPVISIATDKSSYSVGDSVIVSGFVSDVVEAKDVSIQVFNPDNIMYTIGLVTPEPNGSYRFQFSLGGSLATGGTWAVKATYSGNTVSTTFQVKAVAPTPGVQPEIMFNKDVYNINDSGTISIVSLDDNVDPDRFESIEVRLLSSTDMKGLRLTLKETGYNTGVFNAVFSLTSEGMSSGTVLRVSLGDTIKAEYKGVSASSMVQARPSQPPTPPPTPPPGEGLLSILLDRPPSKVLFGHIIEFSGSVLNTNGQGVPRIKIQIKDDLPLTKDEILAEGVSDVNGRFIIPWKAKPSDSAFGEPDPIILPYAEVDSQFGKARSKESYKILVTMDAILTLDIQGREFFVGDTVVIKGRLAGSEGTPISGAEVEIKVAETIGKQERILGKAKTDENGFYTATIPIPNSINDDVVIPVYAYYKKGGLCFLPDRCIEGRSLIRQFAVLESTQEYDISKLVLCGAKSDPFSVEGSERDHWMRAESGIVVRTQSQKMSFGQLSLPFKIEAGKLAVNLVSQESGGVASGKYVSDTEPPGSESFTFNFVFPGGTVPIPITVEYDSTLTAGLTASSGLVDVNPSRLSWQDWGIEKTRVGIPNDPNVSDFTVLMEPNYNMDARIKVAGLKVAGFKIESCDPDLRVLFGDQKGAPSAPEPGTPEEFGLQVDRKQYKAGDNVLLTGKFAPLSRLTIIIFDPDENDYLQREVQSASDGSVSFSFQLSDDVKLGTWSIQIVTEETIKEINFIVSTSEQQPQGVALIKNLKKATLISVKNTGDTEISKLYIKVDQGSIKFVKARQWDRERVSDNVVSLESNKGLDPGHSMIVLLLWDDRVEYDDVIRSPVIPCVALDILGVKQDIHYGCMVIR